MKILLTLRVIQDPFYHEVRDAISHDWFNFLNLKGHQVFLVPNLTPNVGLYIDVIKPEAIILSNGNDVADDLHGDDLGRLRGTFEKALLTECINRQLPVLGVCRGMQFLNLYFGGANSPNLVEHSISGVNHAGQSHNTQLLHKELADINGSNSFSTNSFHNHGVLENLKSNEFDSVAVCGDVTEAMVHKNLPIVGIQWHPERQGSPRKIDDFLFNQLACDFRGLR